MRLLTLILCLWSATAWAFPPGFLAVATSGVAANSCPSGTYEIGYNGDHPSGADYICYESGAASEVASNNTVDSATANYVQFNAANENLSFVFTGDISAGIGAQGTIFFSVEVVDGGDGIWPTAGAIVEIFYSASESISAQILSTGRLAGYHLGGANANAVNASSLSVGTDYRCGYSWDATANSHAIDCVTSGAVAWTSNGGNPDDEDAEAVDDLTSEPTTFSIGENVSNSNIATDDSIKVWDVYVVTGYKPSDPSSLVNQ